MIAKSSSRLMLLSSRHCSVSLRTLVPQEVTRRRPRPISEVVWLFSAQAETGPLPICNRPPPLNPEPAMLKVFIAEHQAQAHLVEDLLRSNGIEAHVLGETLLN